MEATTDPAGLRRTEIAVVTVGFFLLGLAIAVTAASYVSNMVFPQQWLVWVVGTAFGAVALLALEWPRAMRHQNAAPEGRFRALLLLSIPFGFVLSSQVCGLGASACNAVCHIANLSLIGLGAISAVRIYRGQPVTGLLIPMIVVALLPHCICHAPINAFWHRVTGGFAPSCEMLPLGAALFSVAALRGVRARFGAALVGVMYAVMLFIIVGGLLFGFPWQGCVDHPA